ncbi:unnamed protein product [Brassicogethes aeneus]|uniref:Nucleotide exchange factor SIL1 n=1 Tax=Brassicogethes aeneus TaxID=1431903 RepID=A0A9P0FFU4_BRAAE|nr:unnamed protein product [Brassicogethes aeneus]
MSARNLICVLVFLTSISIVYLKQNAEEADFVPTHQWKEVKKGQKIPKGLHVRFNFDTGVTEAKLLDESENTYKNQAIIPIDGSSDKDFLLDKDAIKESLKRIKNDPENANKNSEGFRSYEELKISLADLNLAPKQDSEVITDLLADFDVQMKKDKRNLEKVLIIIEDLDYLSHQIDNAIEFVRQDGFNKIVYKNFNETDPEIKQMTLKLFGSLVQNNGKVQVHCLESGCLYKLLRLISIESNDMVKSAGVAALGSLLRRFPLAQKTFIGQGGVAVLSQLLVNNTVKMQIKIATLISDLLIENEEGRENPKESISKQYKEIDFKGMLLENNWCENIDKMLLSTVLLNIDDHDKIEKCLLSMNTVKSYCFLLFDKSLLYELRARYQTLAQIEIENKNELNKYDFFKGIYNIISEILKVNDTVKSEL